MTTLKKLSLRAAIGINLNVILGAGIFINTVFLAKTMGIWGALTYLLVGLLILPLIGTLAQLVQVHRGGSFYDYAHAVAPSLGFISQWSYFVGKMASCALGIHVFSSLMQTIFSGLAVYSTLALDYMIILFFIALNMLNIRFGMAIQMGFFTFKLIPILFVCIGGLALLAGSTASVTLLSASTLFSTIPLALYTFTGFETTCSIINTIQNPQVNGPRAIMWSYGLSVIIAIVFQTLLFLVVGSELIQATSYLDTFPALLAHLVPQNLMLQHALVTLLHVGIACSCLGAAYGILFSNAWNLHTLATKKLVFFSGTLAQQNRYHIPYLCIMVAGSLAAWYLWITQGTLLPLQQINTTALTLTFMLSALGLIAYHWRRKESAPLVAYAGGTSCTLLVLFLVKNFMTYGITPIISYLGFLLCGYGMYWYQLANLQKHKRNQA